MSIIITTYELFMEFYDAFILSLIENVKVARYVICCNIIDHANKEYYKYIFYIYFEALKGTKLGYL